MRNIAIILAGGSGTRFGADIPKQFLNVNGKMIIEYTIDAFHKNEDIDEIAVVCHADYIEMMNNCIAKNQYSKVNRVLCGGNERYHSSVAAIEAYGEDESAKILFHDAVRPLVSSETISSCISALDKYNAVGVGIKTTDTIWKVDNGIIVEIPNRENVYRAQTPQGFIFETIKEAYKIALMDEHIISTDDCGIVRHYLPNEEISTVIGHENNIKITRKEDIVLLEQIIAGKSPNSK